MCVCVQVWIEFGRIKLPQGLHPNDLEEEWGKLILEMLDREKALRPAVERYQNTHLHTHKTIQMLHEIQSKLLTCSHVQFPIQCDVCASRLELLLQRANKIQNMALDCEEKLTLAKNTLQAVSAEHFSSYILHRFTDTDRVRGLMLGKCTIIWSVTAQRGAYKLSGASVLLGEEIFPLLFQSGQKYTFKQKPVHVPPLLLVPRTCPGQRAARRCSVRGSWPATCRTASL